MSSEFDKLKELKEEKEGKLVIHINIQYLDGTEVDFNTEEYRVRDYVLRYKKFGTEQYIYIPLGSIRIFTAEQRRIPKE